jgi:hypothetical protein
MVGAAQPAILNVTPAGLIMYDRPLDSDLEQQFTRFSD